MPLYADPRMLPAEKDDDDDDDTGMQLITPFSSLRGDRAGNKRSYNGSSYSSPGLSYGGAGPSASSSSLGAGSSSRSSAPTL